MQIRQLSQTIEIHNHKYDLDPNIREALQSDLYTAKNHPGHLPSQYVELPRQLITAMDMLLHGKLFY